MGKRFEHLLYKRRYRTGQQAHERYSKSSVMRKTQIKTTMRHYCTLILQPNNTNWILVDGNGILIHYWLECEIVQPLGKMISCGIKHIIVTWPSNFILFTQEKWKICPQKYLDRNVYSSFIHKILKLGTAQMTISRWNDKLQYIHIHIMESHSVNETTNYWCMQKYERISKYGKWDTIFVRHKRLHTV